MTDLRYPVGKLEMPEMVSDQQRETFISQIAEAPRNLRAAIRGLSDEQLNTPYRPGGWTVRQVVHHLPDSHMNSYVRIKLALTEDMPVIRPYEENLWAHLADGSAAPVEVSLSLLDALHERWTFLLNSLAPADFSRAFRHPELGTVRIEQSIALYAWHGRHHVAHITSLRDRVGW